MSTIRVAALVGFASLISAAPQAQPAFSDNQAIVEFQRALDGYAFQHRQVERRAGESPTQRAMADGMRAARPSAKDGDIFTPPVAAAFRQRIATALRASGCTNPSPDRGTFAVPRPNQDASGTAPIPACLASVLPRLPAELEYRVAGVVLVLVDTHANLVIDVLHDVFPRPGAP